IFFISPHGDIPPPPICCLFCGCGGAAPPPTTSTQCVSPIHTKGRSRNELTIAVNIVMLQN
ncbi:MAG: hypothetical protein ACK451_05470, partial [Pseudanabaena sp.]